ncbi:MAG: hypothetical protein RLZZ182_499 [Pseudomonadota bacterium]
MRNPGTQYALFENVEPIPVEPVPPASAAGRGFSDYVVYVDESGDHSLVSINPDYPVFVLALCVMHKRHYSEKIIPAVEKLKFNYFGHDSIVLHEHEIRKQKGDFAFLSHLPTREGFINSLSSIMEACNLCEHFWQKRSKTTSSPTSWSNVAARKRMPNWNSNSDGFAMLGSPARTAGHSTWFLQTSEPTWSGCNWRILWPGRWG